MNSRNPNQRLEDLAVEAGIPLEEVRRDSETVAGVVEEVGEVLDRKGNRSRRHEVEFGPEEEPGRNNNNNQHWRRDGFQKSRYKEPSKKPPLPDGIDEHYGGIEAPVTDHIGVNQVLDYIGVEAKDKTSYLESFNRVPQARVYTFNGVEAIRDAVQLADSLGLDPNYDNTDMNDQGEQKEREILRAMIQLVGTSTSQLTRTERGSTDTIAFTRDLAVTFGLDELPDIAKGYAPVILDEVYLALVPGEDVGKVKSAINNSDPNGTGLSQLVMMEGLGYEAVKSPAEKTLMYRPLEKA